VWKSLEIMLKKRENKLNLNSYTNEELFEYFKEALVAGEFEVAEKSITELLNRVEKGLVTSPEEVILYWKGMGLLCEMTHREDEARRYFLKVLEIKPDDEESIQHIKRLSGLTSDS